MAAKDNEISNLREKLQNSVKPELLEEARANAEELESKLNAAQDQIRQLQGSAVNQEEFEEISNQNKELQGQLNSASQTIGGLQNQLEDLKAEIEEKDKKLKELEEPHAGNGSSRCAIASWRDGYGRSKTRDG